MAGDCGDEVCADKMMTMVMTMVIAMVIAMVMTMLTMVDWWF